MPHCDQYPDSRQVYAQRISSAHLDGKECLVRISRISLEEAREKFEISAGWIDAIELAYRSYVGKITPGYGCSCTHHC